MTKHSYDKEFKEQAVQYYLDNKDQRVSRMLCKKGNFARMNWQF